ncbi:ead/Ea22-like family protein [Enterobacter kobei]
MSNIDKQALRDAAERADSIGWDGIEYELDVGPRATEFISCCLPATVLALLDELEAKDSTIATQQQEIRTLLNALEQASEKRNSGLPDQKRIIGWRASDYTDETSDPELAKNWAAAIGVLPIFEGDVNTKLSAAAAAKGE